MTMVAWLAAYVAGGIAWGLVYAFTGFYGRLTPSNRREVLAAAAMWPVMVPFTILGIVVTAIALAAMDIYDAFEFG